MVLWLSSGYGTIALVRKSRDLYAANRKPEDKMVVVVEGASTHIPLTGLLWVTSREAGLQAQL